MDKCCRSVVGDKRESCAYGIKCFVISVLIIPYILSARDNNNVSSRNGSLHVIGVYIVDL